jgi:hypothetical protein
MINTELNKEIIDILDNVMYWETCPKNYKVRIDAIIKQLTLTFVTQRSELLIKFIEKLDYSYEYKTVNERQNMITELCLIAGIEQLTIPVVVNCNHDFQRVERCEEFEGNQCHCGEWENLT